MDDSAKRAQAVSFSTLPAGGMRPLWLYKLEQRARIYHEGGVFAFSIIHFILGR